MAKRLIGLDSILRDLDGEAIYQTDQMGFFVLDDKGEKQTTTAKAMLSAVLARANTEDPIRAIDVALKVHKANQHIELDDADVTLLSGCVKGDRNATNLGKAFLLRLLEDAKTVEPKK